MEERQMMQEFKEVKRWEKQREGETSLNMMKTGKGEEKASQKMKKGHKKFCLFSLWKKSERLCIKREVEALRSNSIE